MKRVLIGTFILFCAAVLISQWRTPGTWPLLGGKQSSTSTATSEPGPEQPTRSLRELRSSFKPVNRMGPASRTVADDTNTLPQHIFVEWHGHWYPAETLQMDGDRRLIRYTGYGDEWNEWVGPDRVRTAEEAHTAEQAVASDATIPASTDAVRMQPQLGDFVVQWSNQWYRAEVLERKDDKTLIRYVGYGPEWDEWVSPERAKIWTKDDVLLDAKSIGASGELPSASRSVAPFLVEWGGRWWPANVLEEREGKYLIQYEGYAESWNEWITSERLRAKQQPK